MLPVFFRSSRALPGLSVLAVGLTLACVSGLVFGKLFGETYQFSKMALITSLPTLVLGTCWAALLRWRRAAGPGQARADWLVSIPLAALDAAVVGALLLGPDKWPIGALLGLTVGALVWVPALLATLVVFGAPIEWSQRQARRGLLDAERGEILVGVVCAGLSCAVLLFLLVASEPKWLPDSRSMLVPVLRAGQQGSILLAVLSASGLATGLGTTALAGWRGHQRRRLVEAAEAGERTDYRVEQTTAGRVLVRVRLAPDDYRRADVDEAFFALDETTPDEIVSGEPLREASALAEGTRGP